MNPQESFIFSLSLSVFFLSAPFCDFIADIVQESLPRAIFLSRDQRGQPERLLTLPIGAASFSLTSPKFKKEEVTILSKF